MSKLFLSFRRFKLKTNRLADKLEGAIVPAGRFIIADFVITGSNASFKAGKYGIAVEAMLRKGNIPVKNPVIHFDELDKIKNCTFFSTGTYAWLEESQRFKKD